MTFTARSNVLWIYVCACVRERVLVENMLAIAAFKRPPSRAAHRNRHRQMQTWTQIEVHDTTPLLQTWRRPWQQRRRASAAPDASSSVHRNHRHAQDKKHKHTYQRARKSTQCKCIHIFSRTIIGECAYMWWFISQTIRICIGASEQFQELQRIAAPIYT